MNEQAQQPRAPREWVELTTVTSPETPIVVRVQVTASGRPLYSMEIGTLRDGRLLRHMPVYTQDGVVAPMNGAALAALIKRAEDAVAVDAKRKADEWAAQRGSRDAPKPAKHEERPDRRGRKDRRGRGEREDGAGWR